jgi:DHA1 family inner membrane transport protein
MIDELQSVSPADRVGKPTETRLIAALCVASFLAALNFFAITPFYSQIADDLDTSVPLLGQVATLMILVSVVLGMAVGPLADRYGYRRPLTLGVLAVGVTLAGTGLAPTYPVLLLVAVSGGLADALVFGLPLALAGVRFRGAAQRRAMSWTLGSLSAAPIVGVPLLTTVGEVAGWRVALIAAGTGAAAAAWFVWTSLPTDEPRPASRFRFGELSAAYAPLLRHSSTLRLLGATAFRAVTFIGLLTYLGAFLADDLGLSTRQVGFVYTVAGLGSALGNLVGGRLKLGSPRLLIGVASAVTGISVGLALLAPNIWVASPLLVATSMSSSLAGLAIATLLVQETPAGKGTTMVLNGTLLNVGSAVGAALGGGLIAIGGYTALGLGLPIFGLAAAALAWWPTSRAGRVRGSPAGD